MTLEVAEALLASLAAAFLHELGHILAALLCGGGFSRLRLLPGGLELVPTRPIGGLSRLRRAAILLAGAFVNLVCAAIFTKLELFAAASLGLAAVNLLPIRSLDGGEALVALFGDSRAVRVVSGLTAVAAWAASAAVLLLCGNVTLWILSVEVIAEAMVGSFAHSCA